jgi:glutathione S-transferase
MKLYYMPGACSLAPHIALKEAGLSFDLERVGRDKKTEGGDDYLGINPKGSVSALKLDNGEVLTEAAVIQQYIGDKAPEKKLLPATGSSERYCLHKSG